MPLSRDAILAPRIETVTLSNGDSVCMRIMSGKARDEWWKAIKDLDVDAEHYYTALLLRTICDEKGDFLFNTDEGAVLAKAQAPRLEEMFTQAMLVNGIGQKADAAAKKATPASAGSGSSSPGTSA